MKKVYFTCFSFIVLLLSINSIQAQVLSFDRGKVEFYTTTILSDIEAVSEDVQVKLDVQSGDVEIEIAIESFEFEYELMQEHFNDEYLESDKFPAATFKGKLTQSIVDLHDETEVDVFGELVLHGIKKEIKFKANISSKEAYTIVKCKFPIAFKDFNVEEPSILAKSVAKDVEVKSVLYLK